MGQINANTTFGEGANTFAANTRLFLVNQQGTDPLQDSGTNLAISQPLSMDQNNDLIVTGRNMTLLTSDLSVAGGLAPTGIPTVDFTDTTVQFTGTPANRTFKCNLTATDAIFQFTGTANTDLNANGWGVWGPAGTTAVTWNIPGAQFWGDNGWYVLLNALTPNSNLTGVRFVDATGDFGVYSELPPIDFVGLEHGNFTRPFNGGNFLWALTGGPDRNSLALDTNWSIMAQNDLSRFTLNRGSTHVGCDTNVHLFLINQYRPTIPTGQVLQGLRRQGAGDGRMTVAQGWNPVFVDPTGAAIDTWRAFGYSGSEVIGTNFTLRPLPLQKDTSITPPNPNPPNLSTNLPEGDLYNTTFQNGFLVVDQEFTINDTGVNLEGHHDKVIRVYDYNTQTGDEIGMDINLTFPPNGMNREQAIAAGQNINVQEITTSAVGATNAGFIDLGWAQEDRRVFAIDENINADLTEEAARNSNNSVGDTTPATFMNWYALIKEFYIRNDLREATTFPLAMSSGVDITVDRNLSFEITPTAVTIDANTVELRQGSGGFNAIAPTDIKNTLRMIGLNNTVTWGTRAFPSNITLAGGVHNFAASSSPFMQNINWTFDGTVRIHFTNLQANSEHEARELLGNVSEAIGSNTLQISSDTPITIFSTETDPFRDWVPFPVGDDAQGNPLSNVTLDRRTPPRQFRLSTGSLAGRVAVRNISTGQNIVGPQDVVEGTPFEMTIDVNTAGVSDGQQIRLYYKPNNTLIAGYQLATEFDTVNDDIGGEDVILHAGVIPISPELYITDAEATMRGGVPAGASATVTGVTNGRLNIDITGMNLRTEGQVTQRLMLLATNQNAYFDTIVGLSATEDYIQAGFNSTILAATRCSLTAQDGVTQQFLTAVGPIGVTEVGDTEVVNIAIADLVISGANIPGVILFANPDGVSVGEIVSAVDASATGQTVRSIQTATTTIGSDVDTIARVTVATEGMVQNVERATGYMVGNGNTGTGGRAGSRLNGIRPKSGDYDPTQDYTTVL